jgi:hypothetical protein
MDFETMLLGILATAAFLLPILYIQRRQKSQANKEQQAFVAAAQLQGLQLSEFDFWADQYGIGLDKAQGKLFYRNASELDPQEVVLYLEQVRRCTFDNVHREQNGNRIIDMIVLRIGLYGPKSPELYLPFYNREGSLMLSGELQLAEKWCRLIQQHVAKQPQQPVQV